MKNLYLLGILLGFTLNQCKESEKADLVILNATIYTSDSLKTSASAFAVKGKQFIAVGSDVEIKPFIGPKTEVRDMHKSFIMAGFIEGHGHFLSLGKSLVNLDLLKVKSWQEIVDSVKMIALRSEPGQWIEGRGWHQDKWSDKFMNTFNSYPYHDALSKVSPNNPVILFHASGHALLANSKAMEISKISSESESPKGGRIVKDRNSKLTGVFEENAMDLIENTYQNYVKTLDQEVLKNKKKLQAINASNLALEFGITSFEDAGSSLSELQLLHKWSMDHTIQQRIYAMLYEPIDSMLQKMESLPFHTEDPTRFKSIAVKTYMDGALGSYGAWLMEDYTDNPGTRGQNLIDPERINDIARLAIKKDLQVCVHAIGDRGNKEVLDVFEKIAKEFPEVINKRWRIEHAQHLRQEDIQRFKSLGVIASMQSIHCTSDAPFVIKRLGEERAKSSSYIWRSLLNNGVHLANGTDTPVESINPFECMYAAVTRKRLDNDMVFFPEECMSRQEALLSYTLWNAYASKDENLKGSISINKLADFVVLDRNLLTCAPIDIAGCKVIEVYMDGKKIK
ncbi:MAG: amidohydrolase [Saprospiraceae bacterium]